MAFSTITALPQRAITNPSIEDPTFGLAQFYFYSEGLVPGWLTSHPVQTAACTNGGGPGVDCRPIERWSTGMNGTFPVAGAGDRWVELNAFTNSMIYQSVCMANGESFSYSFLHRGRGSALVADVGEFRIGIPGGLPAGSKAADSYSFPIATISTENDGGGAVPVAHPNATVSFTTPGNGWRRYSGTFNYTGASQVVNIGFVAISSGAGNLAIGNFIDDWQISLNPYVEFSAAASSGNEGSTGSSNTPANRPAIRVGGTVAAPITVSIQVTGGSATIGDDYSLTEPFQSGNTTSTASVSIPAGTYDGVSAGSFFPVPFSISPDTATESNQTVDLNITSAPGATIAGVLGCGSAAVVNSTYTILNDDAPTAAEVNVSGRIVTAQGRGIGNARVTLADAHGNLRTVISNPFGYYRLQNVQAGGAYILTVSAKRHEFQPRVVPVDDEMTGLDIVANE